MRSMSDFLDFLVLVAVLADFDFKALIWALLAFLLAISPAYQSLKD